MGRYLVIWKGMPGSLDKLEEGSKFWDEVMKDFPDIRSLHVFGNMCEGHIFAVFEAPNADRLREMNHRGEQLMHERGLPKREGEFEMGLEIIPLEFEYDGDELVYRQELVHAH